MWYPHKGQALDDLSDVIMSLYRRCEGRKVLTLMLYVEVETYFTAIAPSPPIRSLVQFFWGGGGVEGGITRSEMTFQFIVLKQVR